MGRSDALCQRPRLTVGLPSSRADCGLWDWLAMPRGSMCLAGPSAGPGNGTGVCRSRRCAGPVACLGRGTGVTAWVAVWSAVSVALSARTGQVGLPAGPVVGSCGVPVSRPRLPAVPFSGCHWWMEPLLRLSRRIGPTARRPRSVRKAAMVNQLPGRYWRRGIDHDAGSLEHAPRQGVPGPDGPRPLHPYPPRFILASAGAFLPDRSGSNKRVTGRTVRTAAWAWSSAPPRNSSRTAALLNSLPQDMC